METDEKCCKTCKFYKDGWCELLFIERDENHRCKADYEPKGEIE